MGACYSGNYAQITIQTDKTKARGPTFDKNDDQEINFANVNTLYKPDPEFEDMPEWEGERYKGYGIKRMKGYKCNLKIDELTKKREKFWSSKKSLKPLWRIIHQACVYDYLKAEEYLNKNNISTLNGCINVCVDKENNLYHVPNFCINDPYFEKEILPADESHNNKMIINLIDASNGKAYKVEVKEDNKGKDVKQYFAYKTGIDLNAYKLRLLYGGGIINDDEFLYQHKIKVGHSIQVCKTGI